MLIHIVEKVIIASILTVVGALAILDTDIKHPLPFRFVTYEEYVTALTLHFNISNIEYCVVSSVYELKPDIKEYQK